MDRSPPEIRRRLLPSLLVLGALGLLVFSARHAERWPVRPPPCLFQKVTSIPCPGCGGTRALQALGHGDVAGALRLSPLAVAILAGGLAWAVWSAVRATMPAKRRRAPGPAGSRFAKVWPVVIAGLVMIHWAYLVFFLE